MRVDTDVAITAGTARLNGHLQTPRGAREIVLFAHGSGSGRHSPRNQFVAGKLNDAGLATLLVDLLTEREEAEDRLTARLRFDIGFLADRLAQITDWLDEHDPTREMHVGYFGASTGAGAALVAAAERPERISAVVSRGGRPDLAGEALSHVRAATLLIVGGDDEPVISLNELALRRLSAHDKRLVIVPGATHLFEEPGALETVASLASEWFRRYLVAAPVGAL